VEQKNDNVGSFTMITGFVWAISAISLMLGIAIVCWQVFGYLWVGEWRAISVVDFMQTSGNVWALRPARWHMLHQFLNVMPVSVALTFIALLSFWILQIQHKRK
jgi:hypothetical protein